MKIVNKPDKEKEFVCRPCGKFLESDEFKDGKCPVCGSDEGIYLNDLKEND